MKEVEEYLRGRLVKMDERHQYYLERKERYRRYYLEHRKDYQQYYLRKREQIRQLAKEWYYRNREKECNRASEYRQKIRSEIILLLGGKCSNLNCLVPNGCSDSRCLQIDHIKGGGTKERKKYGGPSILYRIILKEIQLGSKDYQLLCANCNVIKRRINKEDVRI